MKQHQSSILLCIMDDGTINLYVNGTNVIVDDKLKVSVEKIANCKLDTLKVIQYLRFTADRLAITTSKQ